MIGITSYYSYKNLKNLGEKRTKKLLYLIWITIIGYLSYGIYENIKGSTSIWLIFMNIILIILTLAMWYFTYAKIRSGKTLDVIISTIIGTLTNTVGVLFMIYLLYGERFVEGIGGDSALARKIILGIGVTNGIPEVIIAIIITSSVVGALRNGR